MDLCGRQAGQKLAQPFGIGARHIPAESLQMDAAKILLGIYQVNEHWPRGHLEIDGIRPQPADEFGVAIGVEVVFGAIARPGPAGGAEAGAQIAHHENALRSILVNRVVFVLEVPIVDQGHEDPQPIPLPGTGEGDFVPLPDTDFLFVVPL